MPKPTHRRALSGAQNHTLMVVEHDMSFIDTISEQVTVLAQGAILAEGTLAGNTNQR